MTEQNTFLDAMAAYAKKARRTMIPVAVTLRKENWRDGARAGTGVAPIYLPFMPRWFLVEPVAGVLILDVKFGNQSQTLSVDGIPTAMYSMDEALSLLESPESAAWDRFKLEPAGGEPLGAGHQIAVQMEETEVDGNRPAGDRVVRCVFIGDEPRFSNIKGWVQGTLHAVAMTVDGPIVEVNTQMGTVKMPIEPGEAPDAMAKLGKRVKFRLSTED